ncbi:MAG: hypothetical protein AAGE18_05750 [Pseudomonadota bacterium]
MIGGLILGAVVGGTLPLVLQRLGKPITARETLIFAAVYGGGVGLVLGLILILILIL